ncbi:MAG: anaerobic glycerol-3-phosphate dehydrogenase subunit GlpC [Desulfatibacillaceae bacterium]
MIDTGNITFDHCIKCTVCTAYCPVSRATHLYPGPKWSGPDAERLRIKNPELVDRTLSYCTNCKRCEIACPSDVKIADIIQEARHKYVRDRTRPRDYLMSHTDLVGSMATRVAPLANLANSLPVTRDILDRFVKVHGKRTLPRYERGTFRGMFRREIAPSQKQFDKRVLYFTGCFVNYNQHRLGHDVVRVMNALGYGVDIAREKCCGVPLIANGYLADARQNGRHNIKVLTKALGENGTRCVSSSSSCTFALLHEYPNLLGLDNEALADRLDYVTRFVYREFAAGNIPEMRPVELSAAYHVPCHLERMGGALNTIGLLRKIPGLELTVLSSECCGMSGTYGYKKEYYDISQEIGSRLFRQVADIDPDVVVTDCESCKWQIEMNTKKAAPHPITLLALAIR